MNCFEMKLPAVSHNEAFARNVVASFAVEIAPTLEEINDVKTAVSEAVTNAVVHAYDKEKGVVEIECKLDEKARWIEIVVRDFGKGIEDVQKAVEPFFTTAPGDERSGMGFTIIQTFMDEMSVESAIGKGTSVRMKKVMKGC
ncbi:MAG: anti-sigma F factor [Christensenellales bacterium]